MTATWADDLPGSEPDPKLEDFYLLVALKLGNPAQRDWLIEHAVEFHEMYRGWKKYGPFAKQDSATVLIQYMLWYERERPDRQI